jgi:putative addiction module component (TIGR02574 family)
MPIIDEILKLPKAEQIAILEAIQDNLDDEPVEINLSNEHIDFIRQRVNEIKSSTSPTYTWQEMKDKLASRWDTK